MAQESRHLPLQFHSGQIPPTFVLRRTATPPSRRWQNSGYTSRLITRALIPTSTSSTSLRQLRLNMANSDALKKAALAYLPKRSSCRFTSNRTPRIRTPFRTFHASNAHILVATIRRLASTTLMYIYALTQVSDPSPASILAAVRLSRMRAI